MTDFEQPDLFTIVEPDTPADATPAERFEAFHQANPAVYATCVRLARQWVAAGHPKLGIGALIERVRWEIALSTSDPDYRINNNFRAFYARLIMAREPDLGDLFDVRRSVADDWIGRAA